MWSMKPLFPIRSLFVIALASAMIVLMAFAWFIFYQVYAAFSGANIIQTAGTNSTTSDNVIFFFDNLASYMLILGLVFVGIWTWVYSQKKGIYVGED